MSTKNLNQSKRLERIEATLARPSATKDTIMVYPFYDVPNLDSAIERARQAGARVVTFCPLSGPVQEAVISGVEIGAVGVAYEGPKPTKDQLLKVVAFCEAKPEPVP